MFEDMCRIVWEIDFSIVVHSIFSGCHVVLNYWKVTCVCTEGVFLRNTLQPVSLHSLTLVDVDIRMASGLMRDSFVSAFHSV